MKTYAIISIISLSLFLASCSNDELETNGEISENSRIQQLKEGNDESQNAGDDPLPPGEPIKTKGKDD